MKSDQLTSFIGKFLITKNFLIRSKRPTGWQSSPFRTSLLPHPGKFQIELKSQAHKGNLHAIDFSEPELDAVVLCICGGLGAAVTIAAILIHGNWVRMWEDVVRAARVRAHISGELRLHFVPSRDEWGPRWRGCLAGVFTSGVTSSIHRSALLWTEISEE